MRDIHGYEQRVQCALKNIEESKICKKNKETLKKFYKFSRAQQISSGRIAKHLWHLLVVARIIDKDFGKVNKDDIENVVVELQDRKYKKSTIRDYKIALKKFYNWFHQYPKKRYPPEVDWLTTTGDGEGSRDSSMDLTLEDIRKLSSVAENVRDKALVWVLFELGGRVGEFMGMKIKHVSFGNVTMIKLWTEKTMKWRDLPIVDARSDLATLLDTHPHNDDPEAYVWLSIGTKNHGKPMAYHTIVDILQTLAKKAGIKKPVNPHSFRHSRLSFLGDFLTESQLCYVAGWKQGSNMARIYVRPKRVTSSILSIHGIKPEVQEQRELKPTTCTVCSMINSPSSKYCRHCGNVIDMETAVSVINTRREVEKVEDELYSRPEILDQAVRALQQNPQLVNKLRESYPGYFRLAEDVVEKERRA